jgi:uncharacterized membrane protein
LKRVDLKHIPLKAPSRFERWPQFLHLGFLGLFLVQYLLVWMNLLFRIPGFGNAHWPEAVLLLLATASTLATLARNLPGQNVMLASVVIAAFAGGLQCLGAWTKVPFGPYMYEPKHVGEFLVPLLPWSIPLVWVVFLLNARGVARLIMRPWRQNPTYGVKVLLLTVLLVVLTDLAFEPFAIKVKGYWTWKPTLVASDWYTMPWVNCLGWAVCTALILAFATPALIRKKPGKSPADFHPLAVWLLMNTLFLTGSAVGGFWPAVAVTGGPAFVVAALAIWGGASGVRTAGSFHG